MIEIEETPSRWKKLANLMSAIIFTIIWLGLFPFFLYGAMLSFFIFDNPSMPSLMGSTIVFFAFFIPLSFPATILCIWLSYFYKKIYLMYCSNLIPIITIIIVVLVDGLLSDIAKLFFSRNFPDFAL